MRHIPTSRIRTFWRHVSVRECPPSSASVSVAGAMSPRPQRDTNADLARALRDAVRDHAVDPEQREEAERNGEPERALYWWRSIGTAARWAGVLVSRASLFSRAGLIFGVSLPFGAPSAVVGPTRSAPSDPERQVHTRARTRRRRNVTRVRGRGHGPQPQGRDQGAPVGDRGAGLARTVKREILLAATLQHPHIVPLLTAIQWLVKGAALNVGGIGFSLEDTLYAPIRSDPRIQAVIERLKVR